MKHFFQPLLAALLLSLTVTTISAAPRDTKDDNNAPGQREEKMAARLAEEMKLDAETTAWFKPLYLEMQDTLRALRRPEAPADKSAQKSDAKKQLTEKEAAALIEKNFAKTEQEVAIKRYYYAVFMEKMTPTQLVRIFVQQPGGRNQNRQNDNQQESPDGFGPPGGGFPGGGFPGGGF